MRVFVCDQEVIIKFLGELVGSCGVLFLLEQVRDLRVQEFLRKLVVGIAALNDLAGTIIVEILPVSKTGM